nr:transposase [Streptomyces piniterrae]
MRQGQQQRWKAKLAVAKIHARIADQRRDFIEQETTRITRESQAVYLEDLNVKGMGNSKGKRGKSVHDQSLGMFARTLEAKCVRYGRTFVKVSRWFPSTQLCSACGALTGPKGQAGLKIRQWTCDCGARHDRDGNAEINIRREGRHIVAAGRADT